MEKKALHSLVKSAAHVAYRKQLLKYQVKKAALNLNPPSGSFNNAAMGAALGGLVGLGTEAFSNKKRKDYLKSMILTSLLGMTGGLAASYAGAPDMWKKTRPYLNTIKNKAVGTFQGAVNGFKKASYEDDIRVARRKRAMKNAVLRAIKVGGGALAGYSLGRLAESGLSGLNSRRKPVLTINGSHGRKSYELNPDAIKALSAIGTVAGGAIGAAY